MAEIGKSKSFPGMAALVRQTYETCRQNWRALAGVLGVYAVVDLFLGSGIDTISNSINNLNSASSSSGRLNTAVTGLGHILGGSSSSSNSGSAMSSVLMVLELIVLVWVAKQLAAGKTFTTKDAYYKSMGQLIQFLLVIGLIILQLVPMAIGSTALVGVFAGTPNPVVAIVFIAIFVGLSVWSLRMLSGTIFAPFLVSEPGAEPMKSVRAANRLVEGNRMQVVWHVLPLPVLIVVGYFVILLPLILITNSLAGAAYYLLGVVSLPVSVIYIHHLFRSLKDGR